MVSFTNTFLLDVKKKKKIVLNEVNGTEFRKKYYLNQKFLSKLLVCSMKSLSFLLIRVFRN